MKPIEKIMQLLIALAITITITSSSKAQDNRLYFGVEIGGVICGYGTSDQEYTDYEGMGMIQVYDSVHVLLKALGQDMNMDIWTTHILHPETYKVVYNSTAFAYDDGGITSTVTEIHDDYALYKEIAQNYTDTILITDDVIFDQSISAPHLLEDFVKNNTKEKTYRVFDYVKGYISDQDYTLLREENIVLAGKEYNTLVFNVYHNKDGTNTKLWADKDNGMTLKFEIMNRTIYMTDKSVIKKIKTADLDNTIFAKVDKNISNFQEMSYLKVSADLKSAGEKISVESLNFPGQKFEGTVVENHVVGVFEIEPSWYDGTDAPAFPPDFSGNEELNKFLEPEWLIESDHPDIIAMAEKITDGSKDSWEATVLLSEWVGNEISGAIPGGTSAINTYKTRQGECGSHSRLLTAYCRAVGIPARLSIGCMYSTWYGGSFGQHAWTEVYMGEKYGWVAVDATLMEFDYVDAGHLRLGMGATFHPNNMEIIEYRIGEEEIGKNTSFIPPEYIPIIGPYTNFDNRNVLDVVYDGSGISVDILGRMMLALKEPDEKGRMYAKLSSDVSFSFPESEAGKVDQMIIQEKAYASKKVQDGLDVNEEVPEDLRAILGPYVVLQIQKEFTVIWDQGQLAMMVPDVENARPLEKTADEGRWRDPVDGKEYSFKVDEDGLVSGMNIHVTSILEKGATIAWIMDKTIEAEGLNAAAEKYQELWNSKADDCYFSEKDMNNLGYRYLGNNKIEAALMAFKLNVDSYPESWNVYDSYGEALMKNGETEEAIESYEKSIKLNPENEDGKKTLDELKSMKTD